MSRVRCAGGWLLGEDRETLAYRHADPVARLGGGDALRTGRAVQGGALAEWAAEWRDDVAQVGDGLVGAVVGACHPADGLLHEGAAKVVDAAGQDVAAQVVAELDPRALDRVDLPVQ